MVHSDLSLEIGGLLLSIVFKRALVIDQKFFFIQWFYSELGLETSSLLYSCGVYSELRLEISGLSSACFPVNLFRAGVRDQRFVIFLWVYSALRLETSGLLLACYLVGLFIGEVGDQ